MHHFDVFGVERQKSAACDAKRVESTVAPNWDIVRVTIEASFHDHEVGQGATSACGRRGGVRGGGEVLVVCRRRRRCIVRRCGGEGSRLRQRISCSLSQRHRLHLRAAERTLGGIREMLRDALAAVGVRAVERVQRILKEEEEEKQNIANQKLRSLAFSSLPCLVCSQAHGPRR